MLSAGESSTSDKLMALIQDLTKDVKGIKQAVADVDQNIAGVKQEVNQNIADVKQDVGAMRVRVESLEKKPAATAATKCKHLHDNRVISSHCHGKS